MDYRQYLVDAAVEEIRRQLGGECVSQHGTHVQVDGPIKMARVLEAVVTAISHQPDGMIEEVARSLAPSVQAWQEEEPYALGAIGAVCGFLQAKLDPLP
jgi:hypothetical protein